MKNNKRKLKNPKSVDGHLLGAAALVGAGASLFSGILGGVNANKQARAQREAMEQQQIYQIEQQQNQDALNRRQLYDAEAQAYTGSLQGMNSMLQQNYFQNNLTGIPTFSLGGSIDDDLIALSKGEAVNIRKPDGTSMSKKVNGPGTKFSDSVLADSNNIESVSSNMVNPFTGNSFSKDNLMLDKFFGRSSSDRDWLSKNTKNLKQSKKEQIKQASMSVQEQIGNMIPGSRTKTMAAGTPIESFKKGGYVNKSITVPAAFTGVEYAQLGGALASLVPSIYNLTAANKLAKPIKLTPTKMTAFHNPNEGSVMSLLNQSSFPIQQYLDRVSRDKATSNYNARDIGNVGAYRALRLANDISSRDQLANIYGAKAQHDTQQRIAAGQMLSQMGAQRAQINNAVNQMNQQSAWDTRRINANNLDNYNANKQQLKAAGWSQLASGIGNIGNTLATIGANREMRGLQDAYMKSAGMERSTNWWGGTDWKDINGVKTPVSPVNNMPQLLPSKNPKSYFDYMNNSLPGFYNLYS